MLKVLMTASYRFRIAVFHFMPFCSSVSYHAMPCLLLLVTIRLSIAFLSCSFAFTLQGHETQAPALGIFQLLGRHVWEHDQLNT